MEAYTLAEGKPVRRATFKRLLTRAWQATVEAEAKLAAAWGLVTERAHRFRPTWEVSVSDDGLLASPTDARRRRAHALHYFLCAICLDPTTKNPIRALFEHCVRDLLAEMGPTHLYRSGFPAYPGIDWGVPEYQQPSTFAKAVRLWATVVGEDFIRYVPSSKNDFAVDIIGWRGPIDGRGGHLHYMGNCYTGRAWDNTSGKVNELKVGPIRRFVALSSEPVRIYAIPYAGPPVADDQWKELCDRGGLVLDRHRLTALRHEVELRDSTQSEVERFCDSL